MPLTRIKSTAIGDNTITDSKITGGGIAPTGTILPYSSETAPTGWFICDGRTVSRTTYSDLFAVLSTNWGYGDNSTTFNIPDLRGRFLRGHDDGNGNDPDAASRTASNTGGATGDNVGSVQSDSIYDHSHQTPIIYSASASATNNMGIVTGQSSPTQAPGRFNVSAYKSSGDAYSNFNYSPTKVDYSGQAINFVNTGVTPSEIDGDSHPKNANVNYIIKF